MPETGRQLSREEVAKIEIGHTDVRPAVAWGMVAAFLATIFAVSIGQDVYEVRARLAERPGTSWRDAGRLLPRCFEIFESLPRAWRAVRAGPGEGARAASLLRRVKRANDEVLLRDIHEYTDALKYDSLLTDSLLPPAQRLMASRLGVGNEQVYVGRDGWLFYRPGVDYLTAPGFLSRRWSRKRQDARKEWQGPLAVDPVEAIVEFAVDLQRRGIRLVLLPTPVKAMVHPECLSGRFEGRREAVQNRSYPAFRRRLRDQFAVPGDGSPVPRKIVLMEPARELIGLKFSQHPPGRLYLRSDTHWLPEAMDFVARRVAAKLRRMLAESGAGGAAEGDAPAASPYREEPIEVSNTGDLAAMVQPLAHTAFARGRHRCAAGLLDSAGLAGAAGLLATDRRTLYPTETVTIRRVLDAAGRPWQADRRADVLLLGDSFSNIYSSGAMGWGTSAGLGERLSFHLRRPVDAIVRNDDGACATRRVLAEELRAGRDRLAGKKVVVWQFAVRELAVGHWKRIETRLIEARTRPAPAATRSQPAGRATDVLTLAPGREAVVTGRIAALKRSPRPGTVPYRDHIMPVHLVDVRDEKGTVRGAQALLFLWGMRDNRLTAHARLRPGQVITARIRPWGDVARKYRTLKRSELDDVDLDVETFWCEQAKVK